MKMPNNFEYKIYPWGNYALAKGVSLFSAYSKGNGIVWRQLRDNTFSVRLL